MTGIIVVKYLGWEVRKMALDVLFFEEPDDE